MLILINLFISRPIFKNKLTLVKKNIDIFYSYHFSPILQLRSDWYSVYFLALPFDLSTGYLALLCSSFWRQACATSMLQASAKRRQLLITSANSSATSGSCCPLAWASAVLSRRNFSWSSAASTAMDAERSLGLWNWAQSLSSLKSRICFWSSVISMWISGR